MKPEAWQHSLKVMAVDTQNDNLDIHQSLVKKNQTAKAQRNAKIFLVLKDNFNLHR